MLLVIHNLPLQFRHANVKDMIKELCGLTEIIVDKLIKEGKSKKVTIGLADEADADIVKNNLNGIYIREHQLYIEEKQTERNAQQKATAFQPTPGPSGFQQGQVPQSMQAQYNNQLQYSKPNNNQPFQQLITTPSVQPQMCPPPNFNVPFYMTSQSSNDSNNQQFMVQYPQVQASTSSSQCNKQNFGFNSNQVEKSQHHSNSSYSSSTWNKSDKSGNGRDGDRTWPRDNNGQNKGRSPNNNSNVSLFQNKSEQKGRSHKINPWAHQTPQNVGSFEESSFGESSKTYDIRDKIKKLYDQSKEPQGLGEHVLSRDLNKLSPENIFGKNKRPNNDTFKFGPQNKKFGNNQQFLANNRQENFGRQNFKNLVKIRGNFSNNSSFRPNLPWMQQNRQMQLNTLQKIANMPGIRLNRPQMPANRYQPFPNKTQFQANAPPLLSNNSNVITITKQPTKKLSRQTIRSKMYLEKMKMQSKAQSEQSNLTNVKCVQMSTNNIEVQLSQPSEVSETTKDVRNSENTKAEAAKMQKKVDSERKKKWETWLVQATVVTAKQIAYNAGLYHEKRDPVFSKLKERVRARLDQVVGGNMTLNLRNMLDLYRIKYSAEFDKEFYDEVKKAVDKAHREEYEANQKAKELAESAGNLTTIAVEPTQGSSNNAKDLQTTKKPPKTSDDSNKRIKNLPTVLSSQLRTKPKEQHYEPYDLDYHIEKALDAELDKFCDIFMEEIQDPMNVTEQPVCKYMGEVIVNEMRQAVKVNVKRRIMDVRSYLIVKILCRPKVVPQDVLKEFLKPFGVTDVRGTERNKYMYFATCDTYEDFDALCMISSVEMGKTTVYFMPLYILGQPKKFKKKLDKASNNSSDESSDDDTQTEEEYETIMENERNNMSNVIVIDDEAQSKDVVVIDGDDNTVATNENATVTDRIVLIDDEVNNVIDDSESITIDDNTETDYEVPANNDNKIVIIDDDNVVAVDDGSSSTSTNDKEVTVDIGDNIETVTNDEVVTVNDSTNHIVTFCDESVTNDGTVINADNESINNEEEVVTGDIESVNDDGEETYVNNEAVSGGEEIFGNNKSVNDGEVVSGNNVSVNNDENVITSDKSVTTDVDDKSVNTDGEIVSVNNDPVNNDGKIMTVDNNPINNEDKMVTDDDGSATNDKKTIDNDPVINDKDKNTPSFDEATVSDENIPQICNVSDNKVGIDEDIDPNINEDDLEDF